MAVYYSAAAVFALYLLAVPVKIAFILRISARPGFGAGAALFQGKTALRAASRRAREKNSRPRPKKKKPGPRFLRAALAAGRCLAGHLNLEILQARGRICAPDAAATALICGCAYALEAALPPGRIRMQLQPDFSAGESDVLIRGMVSLCAGHIILAALTGAWHYFARR